jgi:hypothetical protein
MMIKSSSGHVNRFRAGSRNSSVKVCRLTKCGAFCLLALVPVIPVWAAGKLVYLYETDPQYVPVRNVQKAVCEAHPSDLCGSSPPETCVSLGEAVAKEVFPHGTATELQSIRQNVLEGCWLSASPYETLGTHWLIQQRLNAIRRLAPQQLGRAIPYPVIYGGYPAYEINAEMYSQQQGRTPIILVNTGLMLFANCMAKLVARTLPAETSGHATTVRTDEASSRAKIQSSPELRHYLIDLIDHFDTGKMPQLLPSTDITPIIQAVYIDGMETFAVAHELGHIYFEHGASSFDWSGMLDPMRKLFSNPPLTMPTALRELEADSYALAIVFARRDEIRRSPLNPPFWAALPYAVEFYFIAQDVMDDARRLRGLAVSDTLPYTDTMSADAATIAQCAFSASCRVSELKGISTTLLQGKLYPSHALRADVVRAAISTHALSSTDNVTQVAVALNRNMLLLWQMTRAEYSTSHHRTAQR